MSEHVEAPRLHREMGFVALLLFLVISSLGIISLPKAGEADPAGITFWVVGAFVFYLPLALCVIILSSWYPGEGGLYLWSYEAFGPLADLPAAFARVHPRWGSPYIALVFQALVVAGLLLIGQAGTSTKGAFDVFLSMTLIPSFIPFVYMFAAAVNRAGQRTR